MEEGGDLRLHEDDAAELLEAHGVGLLRVHGKDNRDVFLGRAGDVGDLRTLLVATLERARRNAHCGDEIAEGAAWNGAFVDEIKHAEEVE